MCGFQGSCLHDTGYACLPRKFTEAKGRRRFGEMAEEALATIKTIVFKGWVGRAQAS